MEDCSINDWEESNFLELAIIYTLYFIINSLNFLTKNLKKTQQKP